MIVVSFWGEKTGWGRVEVWEADVEFNPLGPWTRQ